ncbi:hypothetical protein PR048_000514 [Dryococelus australis]|uniref:Uncharacterized protein n=1 Tax=Dryococelus australis TaxID=614101 RepID=A0ABQ9IEU6_9NEOP|nr:hypothetical protein PR048_000514 [Dryococelus australis]
MSTFEINLRKMSLSLPAYVVKLVTTKSNVVPRINAELKVWAALNDGVLGADEDEAKRAWSSAGCKGRGKQETSRESPAGRRKRPPRFLHSDHLDTATPGGGEENRVQHAQFANVSNSFASPVPRRCRISGVADSRVIWSQLSYPRDRPVAPARRSSEIGVEMQRNEHGEEAGEPPENLPSQPTPRTMPATFPLRCSSVRKCLARRRLMSNPGPQLVSGHTSRSHWHVKLESQTIRHTVQLPVRQLVIRLCFRPSVENYSQQSVVRQSFCTAKFQCGNLTYCSATSAGGSPPWVPALGPTRGIKVAAGRTPLSENSPSRTRGDNSTRSVTRMPYAIARLVRDSVALSASTLLGPKREEYLQEQGKREIPEKTRRPTASSGTIPTCENPVTRQGVEPGSPWWEASVLIAQPPRPLVSELQRDVARINSADLARDLARYADSSISARTLERCTRSEAGSSQILMCRDLRNSSYFLAVRINSKILYAWLASSIELRPVWHFSRSLLANSKCHQLNRPISSKVVSQDEETASAKWQNGVTGQRNVRTPFANHRLVSYPQAGSTTKRESFAAHGVQSHTRPVAIVSHSQQMNRRGLKERGSARGVRDMRISSLNAPTRKALNWRAVSPSITRLYETFSGDPTPCELLEHLRPQRNIELAYKYSAVRKSPANRNHATTKRGECGYSHYWVGFPKSYVVSRATLASAGYNTVPEIAVKYPSVTLGSLLPWQQKSICTCLLNALSQTESEFKCMQCLLLSSECVLCNVQKTICLFKVKHSRDCNGGQ